MCSPLNGFHMGHLSRTCTRSSPPREKLLKTLGLRVEIPAPVSTLLQIPIELRLKIYASIFIGSPIYIQSLGENVETQSVHKRGNDLGILLACRQIYGEARYEWHSADLRVVGHLPCLRLLLCWLKPTSLAGIQYLTIQAHDLPGLDTGLLPSLRELVVNLTADDTRQKNRKWHGLTDGDVYRFAVSISVDAEHDTFRDYIIDIWEQKRAFCLLILISAPAEKNMPSTVGGHRKALFH